MSSSPPTELVNTLFFGFDAIEKYSIQRTRPDGSKFEWAHAPAEPINWADHRAIAVKELSEVKKPELFDVCGVLDRAIMRLGDGHGYLDYPGVYRHYFDSYDVNCVSWPERKQKMSTYRTDVFDQPAPMPKLFFKTDDIVYIDMPSATYPAHPDGKKYQDIIREGLLEIASQRKPVRGIIVDLRKNGGGSMCPMLNGLSPLLGPGILGSFKGPDSARDHAWTINYGHDSSLNSMWRFVENKSENFPFLNTPVAVLSGGGPASSGEITFLSLSGRPRTQSFGAATAGASSGNSNHPISEGGPAVMHLTSGIGVDRHGKGTGGKLPVDNKTVDPLGAATRWLSSFSPVASSRQKWGRSPSPR